MLLCTYLEKTLKNGYHTKRKQIWHHFIPIKQTKLEVETCLDVWVGDIR